MRVMPCYQTDRHQEIVVLCNLQNHLEINLNYVYLEIHFVPRSKQ
jgi:hypothetical protein